MPVPKPLLAACLAVAVGYAAYPYVTLYRLDQAIHRGDATALQRLVNWQAVRQGIKHDLGEPQATDELPAFGASFVRSAADHAIDQHVTPEGLCAVVHDGGAISQRAAALHLNWAFFDSPTQFTVDLSAGRAAPIRVRLELQDGGWQVTRVWLPPELLDRSNPRV